MNLLEILNTNVSIKWKSVGHKNTGTFIIDNEDFSIQIDEYEALNKNIVDIGFVKGDSIEAVKSDKSSAKIIGAVVNGLIPKLNQLDPDAIIISVMKNSGLVESRKNLYDTIIKWVSKRMKMNYSSTEWIENSIGFFKFLSKVKLSDEEKKIVIDQINKA